MPKYQTPDGNTIIADESFMLAQYPSGGYLLIEEMPAPQQPITVVPNVYITERLGFPAISRVKRVIRGLPAYDGETAPTPELSADLDAAWAWAERLEILELNSPMSAALHGLLVQCGVIDESEMQKLMRGEAI